MSQRMYVRALLLFISYKMAMCVCTKMAWSSIHFWVAFDLLKVMLRDGRRVGVMSAEPRHVSKHQNVTIFWRNINVQKNNYYRNINIIDIFVVIFKYRYRTVNAAYYFSELVGIFYLRYTINKSRRSTINLAMSILRFYSMHSCCNKFINMYFAFEISEFL